MIHVLPDEDALAVACADFIAQQLSHDLSRNNRVSFVLTGGGTPAKMYRALVDRHRENVAWDHVDFFWGDERFVPEDHDESNFGMARETMLDSLRGAGCNVFPFPTTLDSPDAAAEAYEQTVRGYFADRPPRFDLVLLGLGDDGHIASLFPGSEALDESGRWALHTTAPDSMPIRDRVTMTLPLLNVGARTIFLVAGKGKSDAVARTHRGDDIPASRIRPDGELIWYLDHGAAAGLDL